MRVFIWLLITHWELLISLSLMHVWLLYSFEAWTYWLYWLILLFILTYWLSLLYDYSAHLDMYILVVAYLIHHDMIDSLGCILSWLSWSMLSLLDIRLDNHISCLACVDLDDIHVLCMTVYCMISLIPYDCMSCLSMWDAHISPYLKVHSLGRPCFPWSRIWYETCCFVCSSTKLVIRNRV